MLTFCKSGYHGSCLPKGTNTSAKSRKITSWIDSIWPASTMKLQTTPKLSISLLITSVSWSSHFPIHPRLTDGRRRWSPRWSTRSPGCSGSSTLWADPRKVDSNCARSPKDGLSFTYYLPPPINVNPTSWRNTSAQISVGAHASCAKPNHYSQ